MIMSRNQNAGRSHSMKIDNSSIERVEEFKYLGTTLTNQNSIQEEIKIRLKLGNGWGMWRVWRRGEMCTCFWWGNLRERDHWGDPDVDERKILKWIFRKWQGVVGTGWSWLSGTGGGQL